ncbi:hypothetical protein DM860_007939 [Cuscuta australis]|uniref:RNase H type-1 domain-containing protein n=1 Tax=Cuscuta australis TaxID=267555 RepID=A0A328DX08_9ASTE|nr:hypothetical protein DM860_007939 [Cuscuta australis]
MSGQFRGLLQGGFGGCAGRVRGCCREGFGGWGGSAGGCPGDCCRGGFGAGAGVVSGAVHAGSGAVAGGGGFGGCGGSAGAVLGLLQGVSGAVAGEVSGAVGAESGVAAGGVLGPVEAGPGAVLGAVAEAGLGAVVGGGVSGTVQAGPRAMAGAVAGAVLGAVPGVSSTCRCFVDAAFAPDSGRVAFGCALFSATNCFLAAINGELLCSPDPLMAEAMACREALSWIKTLDIHNVEILMDCQRVISAISDTSFSLTSYFGSLIVECKALLVGFCSSSISFVRRELNVVAHSLARRAEARRSVWVSTPPDFVIPLLR